MSRSPSWKVTRSLKVISSSWLTLIFRMMTNGKRKKSSSQAYGTPMSAPRP
jgi:hypothetical protein